MERTVNKDLRLRYQWLMWIPLVCACWWFFLAVNVHYCYVSDMSYLSELKTEIIPVAAPLPARLSKAVAAYMDIIYDVAKEGYDIRVLIFFTGIFYLAIFWEMNRFFRKIRNKAVVETDPTSTEAHKNPFDKKSIINSKGHLCAFGFVLLVGILCFCGVYPMNKSTISFLAQRQMAIVRLEQWLDIFSKPPTGVVTAIDADYILTRMRWAYSGVEDILLYSAARFFEIGCGMVITGFCGLWGVFAERRYRIRSADGGKWDTVKEHGDIN